MSREWSLRAVCAWFCVLTLSWGVVQADGDREAVRTDALGDPLPPGALLRIGTLRMKHQAPVWGVAFSPDGKTVASLSHVPDSCIRLWSVATGKELKRLEVPFQGGWRGKEVAFSPDGLYLAAPVPIIVKGNYPLRLWDTRTGQDVIDLDDSAGVFAFSADGKTLVSVRGPFVRVRDVESRKQIRQFQVPKRLLEAMALSPDGRMVAWAGRVFDPAFAKEGVVGVSEVATGRKVWTSSEPYTPNDELTAIAFSPDGKTVAVASRRWGHPGEPVQLFDARTGRLRAKIGTPSPCLAYSPDGSLLALCPFGKRVIGLWDTAKHDEVRQFACPGDPTHVAFSRDGKTLASAGIDGSVRLWEVATGKALHAWPGHQYSLNSLVYFPDGRSFVSHASDHTVRLWDAGTGKELRRFTLPSEPRGFGYPGGDRYLHTLAVSPDGNTVAVCDPGQALYLWDTATGKEKCLLKAQPVCWVDFAPDGKTLASGDKKGRVRLWDTTTGKLRRTIAAPGMWGLLFAPDGRTLLTGSLVRETMPGFFLHNWDPINGEEVGKWPCAPHPPQVVALAISPDGRTLAVGGMQWEKAGHPILLGDTRAGVIRRRLQGHMDERHRSDRQVNGVSFSPDGKLLASAGQGDRSVRIWEASTGQELLRFDGHLASVSSVAFSPDGHRLASGSDDTTILVWDLLGCGRAQLNQTKKNPKQLWADLASDDAAWSYRAMSTLILAPDQAVELLAQELRPIPEDKTRKAAPQLLDEINHEKFAVREAAARELQARGWEVALELRQVLRDPPSADARVRLEKLVANLDDFKPDPEELRRQRAVQVLERIGTGEARALLRKIAEGAPWAEQTRDARAALSRLQRR